MGIKLLPEILALPEPGSLILSREFSMMKMKKKEVVFIGSLLLLAVVLWGVLSLTRGGRSRFIHITVDGRDFGTYSLLEEQTIPIGETNVCRIENGRAFMEEASCPDKLCMHQPDITAAGGTIVCLPNRVIIQGEGGPAADDGSGVDTST